MAEIGNPTFANEALSQRQSILATIGSIGSAFLFLADQAGVAVLIRPPPTITAGEIFAPLVLFGGLLFSSSDYKGGRPPLGQAAERVLCAATRRGKGEAAPPA